MKVIYKYKVPMADKVELEMPAGAKVLAVQTQGAHGGDEPMLWAMVDKERPTVTRHFLVKGTGHEFDITPEVTLDHVGTFQLHGGGLVFHMFEMVPS